MTDSSLSSSALQLISIMQSSAVFRPLIEARPDLLTLFIRAAEVASQISSSRARLIEAVTHAADTSDKVVEVICSGNLAELADRMLIASRATEELGQLLKELVPNAVPIMIDASKPAPN